MVFRRSFFFLHDSCRCYARAVVTHDSVDLTTRRLNCPELSRTPFSRRRCFSSLPSPAPCTPQAVTSYFAQANPNALPYGFVPEIASLKTVVLSSGTGVTATVPLATPAKAEASPTPNPPAGSLAQGVAGVADEGKGSGDGAGRRGEGAPEAVAADGAADKSAKGAENTVHTSEELPVTAVETEEDLNAFVTAAGSERLVLVDFGAEWCKNCKAILVSDRAPRAFCWSLGVRLGRCVAFLFFWLELFKAPLSCRGEAFLHRFVDRWAFVLRGATICTLLCGGVRPRLIPAPTRELFPPILSPFFPQACDGP